MHRTLALATALACLALPATAETLVAARTIRAQTILAPEDIAVSDTIVPGALTDLTAAIGREARTVIYPGRPIHAADLGTPAVVDRNQIVLLTYRRGGLTITVEGRTLGRGAVGERVRVMNVASRTTVEGVIQPDGSVRADTGALALTTAGATP